MLQDTEIEQAERIGKLGEGEAVKDINECSREMLARCNLSLEHLQAQPTPLKMELSLVCVK